jgi:hypothetical protein
MIEPLFFLLEEANVSQRTGVLLLVVTCNQPAPRTFTLSLTIRTGELMAIREGNRQGLAALRLLHEASSVRSHQWLDLPEDEEPVTSDLPSLISVLDDVADDLTPPWAEEELPASEQMHLERLREIQAFLQTMAGACGNDVFLKRVFQHSPSDDWERLMDSLCRDIDTLFGADVAARVMAMGKKPPAATDGS